MLFPFQTKELGPVEFKLLKFFLLFLLCSGFFMLYFGSFFKKAFLDILSYFEEFWLRFHRIESCYWKYLGILIFVSFILRLILALTIPINYDEAITYLNFSKEGYLYTLTHYTSPNNHILHSLLTNFTDYFPFDNTINLRIPNLLVGTITIPLFFYCFSRLINFKIAMFVTTIYSFLPIIIYYGFISRGYSLIILFFMISFYSAIQIIRIKNINVLQLRKYHFILSVSSILGFYSIPSFLYAYISLISYLTLMSVFQKSTMKMLYIIISGILTTILVLLLYSPVLIVSGLSAITGNKFVAPIPRSQVIEELYEHFSTVFNSLISINYLLITVLLLGFFSCYLLFKSRKPAEIVFSLYILVLSPIILVVQSVIPFPRTWIYLIIPILYLLGMFMKKTKIQTKNGYYIYSIAIFLSITQLFIFFNQVNEKEKFSYTSEEVSEFLIDSNAKRILVKHPLIDANLNYIFENKNENILVFENDYYFVNEYDFLVFDTLKKVPKSYELVKKFSDDLFVLRKIQ